MMRERKIAAATIATIVGAMLAAPAAAEPIYVPSLPELSPVTALDVTLTGGGQVDRYNHGVVGAARLRASLAVTRYLQVGGAIVAGYATTRLDEGDSSPQWFVGNARASARLSRSWWNRDATGALLPDRGFAAAATVTVMVPTSTAVEPNRILWQWLEDARDPASLDPELTRVELGGDVQLRRPTATLQVGLGIQTVIEDRGPQIDRVHLSARLGMRLRRSAWSWTAALHVGVVSDDSGGNGSSAIELGLQHRSGFHLELGWPMAPRHGAMGTFSIGQRFQ